MNLRLFLSLLALFFLNQLSAQSDPPKSPEETSYEMFDIQQPPAFPGGETAMMKFISENLKYPAIARENGIQGTIVLSFVIDTNGSVLAPKVIKDIGGGCGKESVRLVESMPLWIPGEANGHPVKVRYTLPIRFKLEADNPVLSHEKALLSKDQMWNLVSEAARNICGLRGDLAYATPFEVKNSDHLKLLPTLELAFKTKLSGADKQGLSVLGQVSEYFYKAQFAPAVFSRSQFGGQQVKLLTPRANFDANGDGMGKIGSLKIPKGIKLVLYSKKKFKGKKLEFAAIEQALEISDLTNIIPEKGKIKDGGKGVNWSLNTQSVKVILPKGFPE